MGTLIQRTSFAVLGVLLVTTDWDGSPLTLQVNASVNMKQTPNGSMILAYQNKSAMNNAGTLALTSGASQPQFLNVPALTNEPSILTNNWRSNNLTLTNVSANSQTPIWIQAFGPGMPGQIPLTLSVSQPLPMYPLQVAQGTATPNWMQLVFQYNTSELAVFGIIGGPVDSNANNAYVIAINSQYGDTGPGTGNAAPPGYYATRGGNSYTMLFNWGAGAIYIAYVGGAFVQTRPNSQPTATVTLRSL